MPFDHCRHDVRVACRSLLRARAFTATAVFTLALGIAGATVMFALIQGVLLRPMPVREQERLIVAWKAFPSGGFDHWPFQVSEIDVIGRESRLFERVGGVSYNGALPGVAVENGSAGYITNASVTGTFFATLGVVPILGRTLEPADDIPEAGKVLVITRGLWERRYGGARDVIGRRLLLSDQPFTIVGVMPSDFGYPKGVEAWMTVEAMASLQRNPTFREAVRAENDLVARMRPGVTREQALAELQLLVPRLETDARLRMPHGLRPVVRSYEDVVVGDVRPAMLVLFAAVGLVLLIANANVANLLLLRSEGRQSELAVRSALGATRGRIAWQLMAESAVLALVAGLVGLAATWSVLHGVVALIPGGLPRLDSVRVDGRVALFTVALSLVSAALAALVPAVFATRSDLAAQLRTGRQPDIGGARHGRRALIVAQVALAVTIVAAAGLLTRSLLRLQRADMGWSVDHLFLVSLSLPPPTDDDAHARAHLRFLDDVIASLAGAPGVEWATPVTTPPYSGAGWDAPSYTAEGQSRDQAKTNPSLNLEAVYSNHFATLGVPIVRGRAFTETDRAGAIDVAIVTEDVAARIWPGKDPIGKRLKLGDADFKDPWRTVVGIVKATRYRELAVARPTLYLPAPQFLVTAESLAVRTALPTGALADLARARVRTVDPGVRVMSVVPFRQLLNAPLARPRFNLFLIGVFAVVSLLLAVIGLYAVMAAYVRQRHTEIGIRLTLGATPSDVRRLVLCEGLRLSGMGALIGLAIAVAATRILRGLLFTLDPLDPASLLGSAALLVGASVLACYLPVRYATGVDPVSVLRAS
jgi:putative ABC transport system permease protein